MRRSIFLILISISALLAPLACNKLPVSPVPPPAPVTPTSICGFAPLAYPAIPYPEMNYLPSGTYTIQNAAQWSAVNGSAPVPPVDFTQKMILEVTQIVYLNCGCTAIPTAITSVCYFSDHIEVNYSNFGETCPPPSPIDPTCYAILKIPYNILVEVPLSNLPITWIGH